MKDKILESLARDFAAEHVLTDLNEPCVFEHLVNFCVLSKYTTDEIDLNLVHTGGDGDPSIDGIGIIINGHIICDPEELDGIKRMTPRMEIDFVFIQSKTSSDFDSGEILKFISGVREFLDASPKGLPSSTYRNQLEIRDTVIGMLASTHRNPTCNLYYVTTGQWKENAQLIGRIDRAKQDIISTNMFASVNFFPIDSLKLQSLHRQLRNKTECTVEFPKRTSLPPIENVDEAYIGVMSCKEYLKLITDDDGDIRRQIFYENVRDFLGDNTINTEIESTVLDSQTRQRFALLNNGVTIIARAATVRGDKILISDYQVVNGCQTSNVLFRCREVFSLDDASLPVRLIVTEDSKLVGEIVKATNRQTEVHVEAFEAILPFHRRLEDYYEAMRNTRSTTLYYERRNRQYTNLNVLQSNIVNLPKQVKSAVAILLDEPHSVHRYYGELLKAYRPRLFQEDHQLSVYFSASLIMRTLDDLVGLIPTSLRPFRYHIGLLFRLLHSETNLPRLSSNESKSLGEQLIDTCLNKDRAKEKLEKAIEILEKTRTNSQLDLRHLVRTKNFTEELLEVARGGARGLSASHVSKTSESYGESAAGFVLSYYEDKGFGFISEDGGTQPIYFLYSSVFDKNLKELLNIGMGVKSKVRFKKTSKGIRVEATEIKAM